MCDDRIELSYGLWKSSDGHPRKKWEARGGNDEQGKKDQVPECLDYDEESKCERKSLRKPKSQEAMVRE